MPVLTCMRERESFSVREILFRKPTRNHDSQTLDSHSDLGSAAACQPSAEAGAAVVAERARVDEFGAVGRPCGETSELAIAYRFFLDGWMETACVGV